LGGASGDVCLGGGAVAHSDGGDGVDGAVEGAVAAAVEAVAHGVSAAGRYRAGAGEGGERGVVAAAAGVGERHDGLGGGDGSDAGALGEAGCEVVDDGLRARLSLSARRASWMARARRRISAWRMACSRLASRGRRRRARRARVASVSAARAS